jgi:hypothetical protein
MTRAVFFRASTYRIIKISDQNIIRGGPSLKAEYVLQASQDRPTRDALLDRTPQGIDVENDKR